MIERTKQFGVPVLIINDKDIVIGFNVTRLNELLFPKDNSHPSINSG